MWSENQNLVSETSKTIEMEWETSAFIPQYNWETIKRNEKEKWSAQKYNCQILLKIEIKKIPKINGKNVVWAEISK